MKYLLSSLGAAAVRGEESHVERIIHMPISGEDYCALRGIRHIVSRSASAMYLRRFRPRRERRRRGSAASL